MQQTIAPTTPARTASSAHGTSSRRIGVMAMVSVLGFFAGTIGGLVCVALLMRMVSPVVWMQSGTWMVRRTAPTVLPALAPLIASTVDVFVLDGAEELPALLPLDRRTGRGVALTTDGWIVTTRTALPMERRAQPVVVTSDRRMIAADRIAYDPVSDLVFLHVTGARMSVLPLREDDLEAGVLVVMPSEDGGIVPATIRTPVAHLAPGLVHSSDRFATMLAINDGAQATPGTPLMDGAGVLVGVAVDATRAIPVAAITSALPSLFREGTVTRNTLGVRYRDTSEFGYPATRERGEGVVLTADGALPAVEPKGPAQGILRPADVILAVQDDVLTNRRPFPELLQEYPMGSRVLLRVLRDADERIVPITLAVTRGTTLMVARAGVPAASSPQSP